MSENPGWIHVARKDLEDAARSKLLWGVVGILVLLSAALSTVPYLAGQTGSQGASTAAGWLQTPVEIFLPILGAMIGYMAIINERDSGSIRVLLGLPLRRVDVIVGKTIGRSLVLIGALLVAGLVGAALSMVVYGTVDGAEYFAFGAIGMLLSVVYVALAIAISASVTSRGKALAGIASVLVLFVYAWEFVVFGIMRVVEGTWLPREIPNYAFFLLSLDPGIAATRFVGLFSDTVGDDFGDTVAQFSDAPWYLEQTMAIPILLLWIAVPLAIGYYRFVQADL